MKKCLDVDTLNGRGNPKNETMMGIITAVHVFYPQWLCVLRSKSLMQTVTGSSCIISRDNNLHSSRKNWNVPTVQGRGTPASVLSHLSVVSTLSFLDQWRMLVSTEQLFDLRKSRQTKPNQKWLSSIVVEQHRENLCFKLCAKLTKWSTLILRVVAAGHSRLAKHVINGIA